jgi:hypothetical protein
MEEVKQETIETIQNTNFENHNSPSSIKEESDSKYEQTDQTLDHIQGTQPTHYTESEQEKALDSIITMDHNISNEPSDKVAHIILQPSFFSLFTSTIEERLQNLEKKFSKDIHETLEDLKYEYFNQNLKCNFIFKFLVISIKDEIKEENPLDLSNLNISQPCLTVNIDSISELVSPETRKVMDKSFDIKSGDKKIRKLKDLNKLNDKMQEKTPTLNRKETVKDTTPKEKLSMTERDKSPSIIIKKNRNTLNQSVIVESTASNKLESKSDKKKSPEVKKEANKVIKKDKVKSENTKIKEISRVSGAAVNSNHHHNNSVLEKSILLNQSPGKKERKASLLNINKKNSISMIIDPNEINKFDTRKSPRHSMIEQDTKRLQIKKEMRRGSAKSSLKTTKSAEIIVNNQKETEGKQINYTNKKILGVFFLN